MSKVQQGTREYFGGMPIFIPFALALSILAILFLGDIVGSRFLITVGVGLIGIVIYSFKMRSSKIEDSEILPFLAGILASITIGAMGLGLGGFGEKWGDSSLLLAVLVASGVVATVRTILKKAAPH